ncbi:YdcF family protein [Flavobacterium yafengii]|uniref:YdcF family protein n=1 Tax=Flavobacterium yafengii TaxID=3041253 RepID=A0AAW6TNX2_9FLAO|nr:YdcF family protein [Flavobacterium yafengii]MDI5950399.1 YdcF family protein [Flavobacterium yafengii]
MKKIIYILIALVFISGYSQKEKGFELGYPSSKSNSLIQDKNFYLLTAIQNDKVVSQLLENNSVFKTIFNKQQQELSSKLNSCKDSLSCLIKGYQFKEKELESIEEELRLLMKDKKELQDFVKNNLRPSGKYENFKNLSDTELLLKAWQVCAKGMNRIMKVYGLGEAPQYAKMDSVSYDVRSEFYKGSIFMWSDFLHNKKPKGNRLFFQESLDLSLSLLYMNHRDEVARYEPLEEKENKKAIANLKQINFDAFDYASVLILGNGPENYQDRLSAIGKLNLQLGVLEYEAKKAPLIIVSGGHAHPFRAAYCEAIEMKKELMNIYHIPEENILIDPFARHTTTNLRNVSRLMIAYQMPLDKKSIVVTNANHSDYVGNPNFNARCMEELGYLPAIILKRLNSTTIEFVPKIESLHQNPIDPLDP